MRDDEWQQAFNAGRAEAEGLVEHINALADSLEAELRDRYGYLLKEPMHKDSQRRFDRDMQEVYAARTALAKYREGR